MCFRLKAGADPNVMDDTGAKPGDVFHDGVSMSQRFEIKKLIRQRYNLMGELDRLWYTCIRAYLQVLVVTWHAVILQHCSIEMGNECLIILTFNFSGSLVARKLSCSRNR